MSETDFDTVREGLGRTVLRVQPLLALDRVRAENERLRKAAEDGNVEIERLRHEIDDYRQAEERLREALGYYAKESNYAAGYVRRDRGKRARAALEEQP